MTRNSQNERDGLCEGSPLGRQHVATYGTAGPVPRPPGVQPPPPYTAPGYSGGGGYWASGTYHHRRGSPSPNPPEITGGQFVRGIVIFLILAAQLVAFFYFYDMPTKLGQWNEAMDGMRKEAKHLEIERVALRKESTKLEKERIALDSSTLKMEGERNALETAIRLSKLERAGLEKQREKLEDEREMLEDERQMWKEERERWEKAREDRVPQGAFWESVLPAEDCRSYGKREYWGILRNIPEDWTDIDACMNMPAEIKGVSIRRPHRCQYVEGSPHIHGFWMVDWDQIDCKPWHQDFNDKVSLHSTTMGVALSHSARLTPIPRVAQIKDRASIVLKPG